MKDRERSLAFMHFNTNKLGVSLDIESEQGHELLLELLADADVFIEDLPPAEAERLGLDYASLEQRFPQLIVAAITPFGSTGPQRDYRAEDLNLYMYGGDGFTNPGALAYDTHPDREPVKLPYAAGEAISGTSAALAIAAALFVQPMVRRPVHRSLEAGGARLGDAPLPDAQLPDGRDLRDAADQQARLRRLRALPRTATSWSTPRRTITGRCSSN